MTTLGKFKLINTQINGLIPWDSFVSLIKKSLLELHFMANPHLVGSLLPLTFPLNCTLHKIIIIRQKGLIGSIPSSITQCIHLEELVIKEVGEISGPIPPEICNMCHLTRFGVYLSDFQNSGSEAIKFFQNCPKSKHLAICKKTLKDTDILEWSMQRL